jgi:hypothetical protein
MKNLIVLILLLGGTLCSFAQDRVETFAHAIARTEGFYIKGTIPNRYHNPGDLKIMERGQKYPGQIGVGKAQHVIFRNDAAGYAALYHQIDKILTGESKLYTKNMTLLQMGKLYAQNSRLWAKNLAHNLGVPVTTTLKEFFDEQTDFSEGCGATGKRATPPLTYYDRLKKEFAEAK